MEAPPESASYQRWIDHWGKGSYTAPSSMAPRPWSASLGVHMRDHIDRSLGGVTRDRMGVVRHGGTRDEVRALFDLASPDLMFEAQRVHRMYFDPQEVQISTLLSIKTGGCPEDCAYCPQSAHYETHVSADKLMTVAAVLEEARAAKKAGASRFCMGAAWRAPKDRDIA